MDGRTTAWVSYLTFIGWIIAFINHSNALVKSSLATFHLRQSFGLMILGVALFFVRIAMLFVPFIGFLLWIVNLGVIVLWVIGLVNAANGEEKPIPVLGESFQRWFNFIR
jgi:uncharacterized membrane protein